MTDSSEIPFDHGGVEVLTLRQIDRMNQVPKGTAFRAFKRARDELLEGRDFFVLAMDMPQSEPHAALLARLGEAGALYPGSRVAVLITAGAYARLQGAASLSPS